jgi:glycosyltransferase involved in cell wall biosynthesis
MRICLLYQAEFPPAERIEKVARTLTGAGHEVVLLCNNYGRHRDSHERVERLDVERLGPTFRSRVLNKIFKFPVFLNPLWIAQLIAIVRRRRIDAIQVVDIPLAPAALAVGRAFGIPVVLDMWENYPEALKGWAERDWKVRLFKNPAVARAVEKFVTPRCDHVFVVVEEQRERLISEGVAPERISVVTNAIDVGLFTGGAAAATPLDGDPDVYKLLYVGFITVERGLDDIIRALRRSKEQGLPVRFYIAGSGNYEPELRALAVSEGVADLVRFTGFVPFEQIQFYIAKSDLCVIPHVRSKFIDTTMPNKLFQYMLMGKPVLVSDSKPLARVTRDCRCGFVFESRNPSSAAAAIRAAYDARDDLSLGERARQAVLEKYTWDRAVRPLADYYDDLEVAPVSAASIQQSESARATAG